MEQRQNVENQAEPWITNLTQDTDIVKIYEKPKTDMTKPCDAIEKQKMSKTVLEWNPVDRRIRDRLRQKMSGRCWGEFVEDRNNRMYLRKNRMERHCLKG